MFKRLFSRLFKAKRPFKLTGPGWVFILYTIGVGAGAINTGNNLLYLVFGVFLGLLIASGFLSDLSLWGLDVSPQFPVCGERGQPLSIFMNVKNGKRRLPSLCVNVTLEGTLNGRRVRLRTYVPFISAGGSTTARLEWVPPVRGRFQLEAIRLSTRYPFGLLEKWWTLRPLSASSDTALFVTPRLFDLDLRDIHFRSSGEDVIRESLERGDGATMLGLRLFAPGDNPRRIHWRASAKRAPAFSGDTSSWLVREMDKDQKEDVLFVCPGKGAALSDAEAEKLVEFLASAARACRQRGIQPLMAVDGCLVSDRTAFLSLWDPRNGVTAELAPFVEKLPEALVRLAPRTVLVMEAFRVADAR